jgi:hypothetical protein
MSEGNEIKNTERVEYENPLDIIEIELDDGIYTG